MNQKKTNKTFTFLLLYIYSVVSITTKISTFENAKHTFGNLSPRNDIQNLYKERDLQNISNDFLKASDNVKVQQEILIHTDE